MIPLRSRLRSALLGTLTLAALALAPAAALSAPLADSVDFFLNVNPRQELVNRKKLCVGETMPFYTSIERSLTRTVGGREREATSNLVGVVINGEVVNPAIGTLTVSGEPATTGADQQVAFNFKALKPGATTLKFSANIIGYWLPGETDYHYPPRLQAVPVKAELAIVVAKCKFKAQTIQRWSGPGYNLVGTLDETEATAGEDGVMRGTGTVTWIASTVVPECISTDDFAPSAVDITGTMNDSGQLAVTLTFVPAIDSASIYCEAFGRGVYEDRSWTVPAAPDPLTFVVSDEGGTVTQPQRIVGAQSEANGTALVNIIVEADDSSVAAALYRLNLGLPGFLAQWVAR